jgi:hypothetical protein
MKASERIAVFAQLGYELGMVLDKTQSNRHSGVLDELSHKAYVSNAWFTPPNVEHRLREIAEQLEEATLHKWLEKYDLPDDFTGKTIGVIAAGNIPAAGYDDFAHALLAGHSYCGKLSSDDKLLLPFIAELLCGIDERLKSRISFTDGRLGSIDAVIATGSNNSSRYFEYYFGKYPHVIRKNRNSVAVLSGEETTEDLRNLGEDVFRYFGLGCRNVTKLFVPEGYRFDPLFEAVFHWSDELMQNRKYMNNYEYNRTLYMLNSEPLLDNNFLVIKRGEGIASPPGVLYFEEYKSLDDVQLRLRTDREQIQCVVTNLPFEGAVLPGKAQRPYPWEYADGVDTLAFLLTVNGSSNKP